MLDIRKFLSTVIINIAIKDKGYEIYSYSFKKNILIKSYEKFFKIDELRQAKNHINTLIKSHYFTYVNLLFTSIGQGVLPSTNKIDLDKFGIEASAVTLKPFDRYYIYAAKSELKSSNIVMDELYIDLLYSPFVILHKLINDNKKDGYIYKGVNLFVLKYSEFIALMIFKDNKITFGSFFELKANKNENEDVELDIANHDDLELADAELEEIDFEELEEVKVDGDLELELEEEIEDDGLETFDFDMMIFDYINNAIKEYYINDVYESDFISSITIFEHEKSSKAMHTCIEDELLIKPKIQKINIFKTMLELSIIDLGVKIDL